MKTRSVWKWNQVGEIEKW